jgi:hypothetical protein
MIKEVSFEKTTYAELLINLKLMENAKYGGIVLGTPLDYTR